MIYDFAVAGGSFAGISFALSCSQFGRKGIILEKKKFEQYQKEGFKSGSRSIVNALVIKKEVDIKNFHFFFVPVDKNIECFDVYNLKPSNDIL